MKKVSMSLFQVFQDFAFSSIQYTTVASLSYGTMGCSTYPVKYNVGKRENTTRMLVMSMFTLCKNDFYNIFLKVTGYFLLLSLSNNSSNKISFIHDFIPYFPYLCSCLE